MDYCVQGVMCFVLVCLSTHSLLASRVCFLTRFLSFSYVFAHGLVAEKAIAALNGRYFAGRSIAATHFSEEKYAAKDFLGDV